MAKIKSPTKRKEVAKDIEAFLMIKGLKTDKTTIENFVADLDKKS